MYISRQIKLNTIITFIKYEKDFFSSFFAYWNFVHLYILIWEYCVAAMRKYSIYAIQLQDNKTEGV